MHIRCRYIQTALMVSTPSAHPAARRTQSINVSHPFSSHRLPGSPLLRPHGRCVGRVCAPKALRGRRSVTALSAASTAPCHSSGSHQLEGPATPRPIRIRKMGPLIYCCASATEYQRLISLVNPGEHIFEVAEDAHRNTDKLARAVGASGLITSAAIVGGRKESAASVARSEVADLQPSSDDMGNVHLLKVDTIWESLREAATHCLTNDKCVTTVFMDPASITGSDLLMDTMSLVNSLSALLNIQGSPRLRMVVKSRSLAQQRGMMFHASKVLENPEGAEAQRLQTFVQRGRGGAAVLAAQGVEEYRRAAMLCARPGDKVLELGCHLGTTTRILAQAVGADGAALGVDVGKSIVERAKKADEKNPTPGLSFQVGDAWSCQQVAAMGTRLGRVDIVLLDVGGISSQNGLMEGVSLVRQLLSILSPRVLVAKSTCLREHAGQLIAAHEVLGHNVKYKGKIGDRVEANSLGQYVK